MQLESFVPTSILVPIRTLVVPPLARVAAWRRAPAASHEGNAHGS